MIDWSQVAVLRDELGAEGFQEVVALFLEEVEIQLSALHAATGSSALAAELHALKGSALNLGFAHLAQLCANAELAVSHAGDPVVDKAAIDNCFRASRSAFLDGLGWTAA